METPTVRVFDFSSIKKRRRNSSSSESSSSTVKGCSKRTPLRKPSVSFARTLKKERFKREKKRSKLTGTRLDSGTREQRRDIGSSETGTPTADSASPSDSEDEAKLVEQSLLPLNELSPSDDSTPVQTRRRLSNGLAEANNSTANVNSSPTGGPEVFFSVFEDPSPMPNDRLMQPDQPQVLDAGSFIAASSDSEDEGPISVNFTGNHVDGAAFPGDSGIRAEEEWFGIGDHPGYGTSDEGTWHPQDTDRQTSYPDADGEDITAGDNCAGDSDTDMRDDDVEDGHAQDSGTETSGSEDFNLNVSNGEDTDGATGSGEDGGVDPGSSNSEDDGDVDSDGDNSEDDDVDSEDDNSEDINSGEDDPRTKYIASLVKDIMYIQKQPQGSPCTKSDVQMILKQMLRGVRLEQGPPTTSREPRARDRRKSRSLLPSHQSHDSLEMKAEVRKFAMKLLNRKNKLSPFRLPSTSEFTRFETRKIGGPSKNDFRVQLIGSLTCRWNRHAAEVFSHVYVKRNGRKFKPENLAACFMTHLRTLKNQYDRIQAGPSNTQADIDRCKISARRTRRQGIARRRGEVLEGYGDLRDLAPYLNKLGVDGMSGDESDHSGGQRRYVVRKLNWRSDEVTNAMRVLDALALVSHWTRDGRPRPGKFPHVRIDSDRAESRDPVPGLPLNFYRSDWLKSLDKYERKQLKVGERVELAFPSRVMSVARRYRDASDPQTPPLPEGRARNPVAVSHDVRTGERGRGRRNGINAGMDVDEE